MNWFAHVWLAARDDPAPAFALGAALPDLASMAGARLRGVEHESVQRGLAHHLEADTAFHALSSFRRACASGARELRARGLGRGRARAAAHVAVEIRLDGLLLERCERGSRRVVREALEAGAPDALARHLDWRRDDGGRRWEALRRRLLEVRAPHAAPPGRVGERVVACLGRRPRLELDRAEQDAVTEWAATALGGARLDELLEDVRADAPRLVSGR